MKRSSITAAVTIAAIALGAGAVMAKSRGHMAPIAFEELDTNADGQVTKEEMAALRATRFEESDTNGDGGLSLEELQAHAQERAAKRAEHMMSRRDANGDGQLTMDELGDDRRAEGRFDRMDSDGDGAISKAEFDEARANMKRRHGNKDKN